MRHPDIVTGLDVMIGIARDVKQSMIKEIEACRDEQASDNPAVMRPTEEEAAPRMEAAFWELDNALEYLLSAKDEAETHYGTS